ncbi:MAG: hypothetical protein QCI00_02280 [Candidatus Thermoplasmatota archaeon]|nr:hypothetical protein [Candidatus Thermoplasmatota archaeon]
MKKRHIALLLTILLGSFFIVGSLNVSSIDDAEYNWVLVEIIDYEHDEEFENYNSQYENIYRLSGIYERNHFIITRSYIGKTDTSLDPPKIHGESVTFQASFSQPPEKISEGENVTVTIKLDVIANNQSFFTPFASVRAQMGNSNLGYWDFENEDEEGFFRTDSNNDYISFDETVTATTPKNGRDGDELEIRLYLYSSKKLETWYIYEWQREESTSIDDNEDQSNEVEENQQDSEDEILPDASDNDSNNLDEGNSKDTSGFGMIAFLASVAIALILWRRKK